jgi:hypothetical protein
VPITKPFFESEALLSIEASVRDKEIVFELVFSVPYTSVLLHEDKERRQWAQVSYTGCISVLESGGMLSCRFDASCRPFREPSSVCETTFYLQVF